MTRCEGPHSRQLTLVSLWESQGPRQVCKFNPDDNNSSHQSTVVQTLVFNAFVFAQIWNLHTHTRASAPTEQQGRVLARTPRPQYYTALLPRWCLLCLTTAHRLSEDPRRFRPHRNLLLLLLARFHQPPRAKDPSLCMMHQRQPQPQLPYPLLRQLSNPVHLLLCLAHLPHLPIRFEDCTIPETRIQYMMDGMLQRECLRGTVCVTINETYYTLDDPDS
jgi:hypothetical protein